MPRAVEGRLRACAVACLAHILDTEDTCMNDDFRVTYLVHKSQLSPIPEQATTVAQPHSGFVVWPMTVAAQPKAA
jgi:hypothetical protein